MKTLMQFLVVSVLLCSCMGTTSYTIKGDRAEDDIHGSFTGTAEQSARFLTEARLRVEANTRRLEVQSGREISLKALDYGWPTSFSSSPYGTNAGVGFTGGGMGMGMGMMGGSPLVTGEMMSLMGPQDPFGVNGGMYAQPNQQQAGRGNVQMTEDVKCPMEKPKNLMTPAEKDACRDEAIRVLIERK